MSNDIPQSVKKETVPGRLLQFDPPKAFYWVCLAVYAVLFLTVSAMHEPWLDEAQAWMIGRDASYYDMLFVLPHYEGHPSLWWLLLSLPAKAGLPYEAALSGIMFIISVLTAYLIMFRSPFCPVMRVLVPFTYFFFYQYAVIARPYGLMMLGFVLAAMFYGGRNEKPVRYVAAMMLICSSSAFGIVLCGGLAIVWCAEIIREYGSVKRLFSEFIRSRRFFSLLALLVYALVLIASVIPRSDTFSNDKLALNASQIVSSLWYMLFMLPADGMLIGTGGGIEGYLRYEHFPLYSYIEFSFTGICIMAVMTVYAYRKKKLAAFLVPYLLMVVFGTFVYFIIHHIGIAVVFYLFVIWICAAEKTDTREFTLITPGIMSKINAGCTGLCIVIGIVWSISSSAVDIRHNYYYGREAAEYIKEHDLDKLNIMSSWFHEYDLNHDVTEATNNQHHAETINPYFDRNIFFTLNMGDPKMGYILHRMSDEITAEHYAQWRKTVPDILVGETQFGKVYPERKKTDYILIKSVEFYQPWEMSAKANYLCIYMRRDLFAEHPDVFPENPADEELIDR